MTKSYLLVGMERVEQHLLVLCSLKFPAGWLLNPAGWLLNLILSVFLSVRRQHVWEFLKIFPRECSGSVNWDVLSKCFRNTLIWCFLRKFCTLNKYRSFPPLRCQGRWGHWFVNWLNKNSSGWVLTAIILFGWGSGNW